MIKGPSPFKVVKTHWHKWICEGPYQSGKEWEIEEDANEEAALLNSVYNTGYAQNPDRRIISDLKHDIDHAYAEAKKWIPDYPWDDKRQTASQAVWACGSGYEGVSKACEDWRRLFKHFAPEQFDSAVQMARKNYSEYLVFVKKLEDEEKVKANG